MLDLVIIRTRYTTVVDGAIVDGDTSFSLVENLELHEAIDLCRKEGLTFKETGTDYCAQIDGAVTVDYGTGEMEEVTVHPQGMWWPHEFAAWQAGVDGEHGPSLSFGYLVHPRSVD